MARGWGSVKRTKKCMCDNKKWNVVHQRKVMVGKNFGKTMYTVYCNNCRAQWETLAKYAEKLAKL